MKKLLLLNLILLVMGWCLNAQTATPPASGDGSTSNPYQIASLENLYWISVNKGVWDKHFVQTADIDASATASWPDGGWKPIGTFELDFSENPFTGSYDGTNHSISGLTINRPNSGSYHNGMLGFAKGATIQNLGLHDVSIVSLYNVGGLGGRLLDCIVTNCQITGSVTTTINDYGYSTGGLAAILYNSTLSNCHSTCSVSGTGNVGGMIGTCSLSTIFDCHSSGNIGHSATTTYSKIGGFAGLVQGSSLSKIFSTGNVTATGDYTSGNTTGGFVGHSSSYFSAPYQSNLISDCYCSGNVSGGSKIGGFVGNNYCVSGTSTITKCYSRGIITGTGSVWGFVGENSGTIYNCYFDADVDGLSYTVSGTSVYGSIGKSTAEMKTQSTYTDWDFTFIWGIGEGNNDGYPFLLPSSTCSDGTIVLTSGPESQTVCYGTAISPIVYTIGGGATGAEVSGLPDGLTGALSGETFTITGTSTVSGSFPYTVTTSGAVSPCINATATGTITIFGYSGGNGTESNPFQIATLADLKFLSENSCHWDKHFIQTADIDASATNTWDDGKGWLAIGTSTAPFYGTYDGMLHTISNLYINRPYAGNQGLFGYISNFLTQISMIKNLGVTNVNINARNNIGGLVGFNLGDVSNCYSTGTVVASDVEVGGLVGQNKGSITYCYSEADVTGYWLVGGLVGNTNGYGSEIINCYSRGSVTSVSEGSGGLVGVIMYDALIRNCYSTGLMNNSGAGGLVGLIDGVGSVINSFWDVETSGVTFSAGGTAKTTAEMKIQSTFTGWEFMTIWSINPVNNDGYPHLITESACVDGILPLISGSNNQILYTNTSITPIVYYVGGGASGVSISPTFIPLGLSGVYDAVSRTFTISGLSQANITYNYSLTTTGTKFPCKEATVTGSIKVIIQPSVKITGTNSPICYGSDAKFYLEGTTGVEVTYSLDGGTTTSTVILVEGKATIEVKGATSDKTLSLISARNTEYGCTFALKGTSAVIVNNLPAASISGDHEGCVSTTLTAGTDASTPIYEWYKEGVLLAGESNSTLVATQAGSYAVKVTDGITKCSNISDDFAVILSTHTVSITANNQPICYGSDAEFYLEGTPGTVVTYSFDGGTSQSTIPLDAGSASVIYKQAVGDVTLSLISIELTATGCTRELTETSTVKIYTPTAIISGNQVSCVSTTLTAETDALKPIYEWHKNGALLEGESSSMLTVTQSGAYTLMVSDVSTKCSNISGDFNVTINPLPEVTIIGNNSSICYITDAEFYLEGTPGAEVTYNFNGGSNRTRILGEGITTVTFDEAPYDITLSLESIYNPSTGCRKFLNTASTVIVNPDPYVSIDGYHEDCQSTTLKAVTDTPNPVYAWLIAEGEEPIQVGDGSTLEVTQSDDYYLFVTDKITRCFGFSGPFAVSINPLPAVAITGNNSIIIGETTTVSPITGGTWKSNNEAIATITDGGIVKGIAQGSATFTFTDENTGCKASTEAISVTGAPPVFTTCPGAQTANAVAGLCSAVVTYEASASGSPEPIMTYEFSGATIGSGSGSGSGTAFNTGDTYVTISVSNGIAPDATCSFIVTVTDNEAPEITCAPDVAQNVDPGMCSAVVNVVPRTVTDNCDNNVFMVSNTELIKNGNFNAGTSNWRDCSNAAEVNTEEYYIVPEPPHSSNFVAEIDGVVRLCQEISGFTVGNKYVLTFNASRRQNDKTPNPVSATVAIDGGALSQLVTRANTVFDLTPESFEFTATQTAHKLTFTPYTDNKGTLGLIVDDVSVRCITYPVGPTTLVWTATDDYGNTATCEQVITVTDNEAPIITDEDDITQTAGAGMCSAVVAVTAPEATDNCGILGSVVGTRSDAPLTLADSFPVGTTTITWTVSDIHGNSATPVTQLVTVTDNEAPKITCAPNVDRNVDPGMCSAVLAVDPPTVTDNCDNNVFMVSNTELIKNGNFNAGTSNWRDCSNAAEVNTEEYYIVPEPPHSSNFVAEIDGVVRLCQEINGFTIGNKYVLTFKASRRQNDKTPNPVSANVVVDGGVLSEVVSRTNTVFDLTLESFEFTATQTTHKLTFTPYTDNKGTLGLIVDDISIKSITYQVGPTTLVWTATDDYGNTATCEQIITVTDNEAPVITDEDDITQTADAGMCSTAVTIVNATATDNCGILGSVVGTRSDAPLTLADPFPVGTTTITWTVSDIHGNSATPVTQLVTVTDNETPEITCAPNVDRNVDPGMCSAVLAVDPPTVTDNCDNNVFMVSNTELIKNGNFNAGTSNWRDCNNAAEVNTEEYYVVPEPPHSSNFVAEIDGVVRLCQEISGFTIGNKYVLTFKASRRQNDKTPNPVSATVAIDGGALSQLVTRANTVFDLTAESYEFTATQTTHKLTFTPYSDNKGTLGLIVDDVSVRGMTYPVGTTTLVWTATDDYGNTATCEQEITVTDNEAPTLPDDRTQTVECFDLAKAPTDIPVANDNCDGEVNGFLFSVTDSPNPLIVEGTRIYKYIYTDADENVSYWTCTYKIVRTTRPQEVGTPVETSSTVECFDLAVAPNLPDVQNVCGTQLAVPEPVVTDTPDELECEGTREYRYTYVDDKGLAFVWVYTYTIDDTTPPELICKNMTVVLDRDGKASIVLEDILESGTDNCGTINYEMIGQTTFTCEDVPSKTVTLKATDCAGNIATCEATVTIDMISTSLVYSGVLSGQYSDPVKLEATLTEGSAESPLANRNIVFTLGEQTVSAITDEDGIASATLTLDQKSGPYKLVVRYEEECPYASTSLENAFTILPEKACLDYTGVVMASTGSVNSTKATILLSATFTQEDDGYPGKLSDAHVQFFDMATRMPVSPVLTPGLVNPDDPTFGSVVFEWELDLGTDQSRSYDIYVIAGTRFDYYHHIEWDCISLTTITVYKPGTEFIAGGGYLILEQPSGSIQADVPSKNNFGFNVKFNKKGTNLQGNINTIVRKTVLNPETEEFEQHCYQIKGNVLSSLAVGATVDGATPAVFTGKANLQDVSDPENPISVDGNFVLKVTMTDKGEPGSSDMISITAFDKSGGIWFTSRWQNNKPVEQLLAGGNLVVMGAAKKSAQLDEVISTIETQELKVYPNPFSDKLNFEFVSPADDHVHIDIMDLSGRRIETVFDNVVKAGVTYNAVLVPDKMISGIYLYRMVIGDKVSNGKVIFNRK